MFREIFGRESEAGAVAPGRVNLLGEHTDYNDGFVLPTPIQKFTTVEGARLAAPLLRVHSASFGETAEREIGEPRRNDWLDYVNGCATELLRAGHQIAGAELYITSNVPLGMGVSSSASLEVAVLRCLRMLYALKVSDEELAKIAQRAEWNFAGVKCGIMDQMAIAIGKPHHALFLDTRDLKHEHVPIPDNLTAVVVDSGIERKLAESGYNTRRAECEEACRRLGIKSLRELGFNDLSRVEALPSPYRERARHVVTENERVRLGVVALRAGRGDEFGKLMNDSHVSLRDDYQVSVPGLDELVARAQKFGALGARLTGAGFGGAMVALVETDKVDAWQRRMLQENADLRFLT